MKRFLYSSAALALGLVLALQGASAQAASGAAPAASSDDDLFGTEVVTEAAPQAAAPEKAFLKYDQVKIGGSISGSLGLSGAWLDLWNTGLFTEPDEYGITPYLKSKVTITAKPAEDFGVNLDFRMTYPFSSETTVMTSSTTSETLTIPNISVWAAYAKFSVGDTLFMSFGKQPIAWGVSKGFFQPADDIYATDSVDYSDFSAEREGPLAFKAMLPIPLTMTSFYFYTGLPTGDDLKPEDLRFGLKGEFNTGNTEVALAGFYGYNDYPRAILMATTGTGDFNFFGEAILKYGSERYFINENGSTLPVLWTGSQAEDQFYFTGTLGGSYTDSNNNLTILAQVMYNGEAQDGISAKDAYTYYALHSSYIDRMKLNAWYAGFYLSKTELFTEDLSLGCYAVADLSDLSAMVVPSVSYSFTDYMAVKLSGTFYFGESDDEYIMPLKMAYGTSTPGASFSLSFTLGSGTF